jgi:adenylate cyclase
VTADADPDRSVAGMGRVRWIGVLLLAALALLLWVQPPWVSRIQLLWFDTSQTLVPRTVKALPATIVEIDQKSIVALGQWPWPRTVLAQLVREIARANPVAIGLDILMPESDRSSPEHWLDNMPSTDADLAQSLSALPSHDTELARAIGAARVVLGMAGSPEPTGMTLFATPILIDGASPNDAASVRAQVAQFEGVLNNLPVLERAASGHGLLSAAPDDGEDGVIRRLPMVASVDGTLVPAFAIEMLRVAVKAPVLRLRVRGGEIAGIAAGGFSAPTEADGGARIHFSPHDPRRFVSAIDVLQGRADPEMLASKFVLVGMTGLVQVDYQGTPLGERMPGVEIHAQLIENLFEQGLIMRPTWARALEIALFVLLGGILIRAAPLWRTPTSAA